VKDQNQCAFCSEKLDLGRELVFQVELIEYGDIIAYLDQVDNPVLRAYVESHRTYAGEPLRICRRCHVSIEENKQSIADEERESEETTRQLWKFIPYLAIGLFLVLLLILWILSP
jgi:predicted nucleic acid-binding Zn ribbon protein